MFFLHQVNVLEPLTGFATHYTSNDESLTQPGHLNLKILRIFKANTAPIEIAWNRKSSI